MAFVKIVLLFTLWTAVAVAQTVGQAPLEKIITLDASNGAKQSGVISRLPNATEPSILVAIIPGSPVLARATANFFTSQINIQQGGSFVVRERLRLLDNEIWTSHATVDKLKPQFEARSNASGLTPPKWLWRRVRL